MSSDRIPNYHRIYLLLREAILDGTHPAGSRLPGENELARMHDVSRITTKRALNELERAGLVVRERGRGTTVRPNLVRSTVFDGTLDSLEASNRIIGQSEASVLAFALEPAPVRIARALGKEPERRVYRIERVRSSGGEPFCHVTTYLPEEIGRGISAASLESRMLVDLIEQGGASIESAEQTVGATIADSDMAAKLDVDVGSPLLRVERTVKDGSGRVVEFFTAHFRPDRFRLSMSLERDTARSAGASAFRLSA